jgi:CRISPR-associated protein (TIGR02584 family)
MNSKTTNRILLAVAGSTPQIISETLYYYIKLVPEPQMFSKIVVITTEHGRKKCLEMFYDNWLIPNMYSELGIGWKEPEISIEVIADAAGASMSDIRTVADNERAAEKIFAVTRELCRPPENRVFASLAGGRKTMSSLLMLALSLYAKRDDILSHVLVQPSDYESNPDFYYPTAATPDVRIEVSEVPFFRLGEFINAGIFGRRDLTFQEILSLTRQPLAALRNHIQTVLDPLNRRLTVEWGQSQYEIKFQPKELAIYRYFFESPEPLTCNAARLKQLYRKIAGSEKPGNFSVTQLQKDISQINKLKIEAKLPDFLAGFCQIKRLPNGVENIYQIDLPMQNRHTI